LDGAGRPTHGGDGTRFIYLNVEPADMGEPRTAGINVVADVKLGAQALYDALPRLERRSIDGFVAAVKTWSALQTDAIEPQRSLTAALRDGLDDEDILVSELTQVGYFATIGYPIRRPRTFVTPGYQGTLGYGFGAALGAAAGNPGTRVVSITGDGGFGWELQELATLARYRFDLSVVIFVDGHFGNVKLIQSRVFKTTYATELSNPDFAKLADAFGIPSVNVAAPWELAAALRRAKSRGGPAVIAVTVGEMPSAWPLIHHFAPRSAPPPPPPQWSFTS
jgi:acetolactate synthase-1/2/3 large subunit